MLILRKIDKNSGFRDGNACLHAYISIEGKSEEPTTLDTLPATPSSTSATHGRRGQTGRGADLQS
jgi:hypothetical protein